jgi:prepilin-type N-terminal cleavage/methylation domain-containing protein
MTKLNNKGFTLVEMLAVIAILSIMMGAAIQNYTRYKEKARNQAYDTMASSAEEAAEEYVMDHATATEVTFQTLLEQDYLNSLADPRDSSLNCDGKVVIKTEAATSKGSLESSKYYVSVCCTNYSYTYTFPGGEKEKDKYCKAYPYDINTVINDGVKVLNVYPNRSYATYLKEWMSSLGDAAKSIEVTPVYIVDFNNDPQTYLGTSGNWNYDVIVFGFSDCNSSKDLNETSANLVDKFLSEGNSAIFGHDTITTGCGNHVNFIKLQSYVNIQATTDLNWTGQTQVTIQKKGIFTEYPFSIGDVGTTLTIPRCHVYGQVASGDVWLTFNGISNTAKSIYLTTWGNNAFIQTGHSSGQATDDEKKIIANIILYAKAKQYGIED